MNRPVIKVYLRSKNNYFKWNTSLFSLKSQYCGKSSYSSSISLKYFHSVSHCQCDFSTISVSRKVRLNILSNTTNSVSCITKRNFSLKESMESMISTHSSIFQSLSESKVVEYSQNFIVQIHDISGLPWWLSIILTTCLMRAVLLFPLAVYQQYVISRYINVRKEMESFINDVKYDLNREVRNGRMTEKEAKGYFNRNVKKEYNKLIIRDNCHPAKGAILSLVQIPTWIIVSTSFRNLVYKLPYRDAAADIKFLELSVGGTAWFPNLTVPDDFILPIMLGLTNLAIIEIQSMLSKDQQTKFHKYIYIFFRGFSLFMIPVATFVPSCITLYWLTSSVFGLCQNLVIISPRLRRVVGIPPTPLYKPHPYAHLAEQIANKFRK